MRIEITEILANDKDGFNVSFVCPAGQGIGVWQGLLIEKQNSYDIEIDIDIRLDRSSIIRDTRVSSYKISCAKDSVTFQSLIDAIDDDGMAYLRLDKSLLMIESDFIKADIGSWTCFTVPVYLVTLFPFGS